MTALTALLDRYISLQGRLARLPFFIRGINLSIAALVLFFASIPLFANGGRVWWWAGLIVVIAAVALIGVSTISLFVRRLHDMGYSGYHVIWVAAAEAGWTVLSYGPADAIALGLPLLAISGWLAFWPGNAEANRFGTP